ncbi:MAG: ABC transporter ATP-binding protein [Methanocalculaceae archaeon]|jgi:ABC-type thiamine transport system ATPase subunit|nr:ABC transporter ATP-binding protein [Methanocalculaceae archaeon]
MLVSIAAAFAIRPVLSVLDEPDSHLNTETAAEILQLIRESGCSHVLWSTHSIIIQEKTDCIPYARIRESAGVLNRIFDAVSFSLGWFVLAADAVFPKGIHLRSCPIEAGKSTLAHATAGFLETPGCRGSPLRRLRRQTAVSDAVSRVSCNQIDC